MDNITGFLHDYKIEFGERKLRKLEGEISSAKRCISFISECRVRKILPSPSDFYGCIMNSVFYSFANKYKLTALSLLLLNRWNE